MSPKTIIPPTLERRPTKLSLHNGIQCDDKEWNLDKSRKLIHLLGHTITRGRGLDDGRIGMEKYAPLPNFDHYI